MARKGTTGRSFQSSRLGRWERRASLAILCVTTVPTLPGNRLSQALGHFVCRIPTLDSELETCGTCGWQTGDRRRCWASWRHNLCFEGRAISKSRTKQLGLSALSISSYLHICSSFQRCLVGEPNICLNHFTKPTPSSSSNEQAQQNLVNKLNGVGGSDMANVALQGSLPFCSCSPSGVQWRL